MATKVKPTRLNISGTPSVGQVPTYVNDNTFAWGAGGGGGGSSYGRFLSLWDCTTGQPISFPEATPYTYLTGDYYIVSIVSSATPPVNYRPNGSSYTGTASSTAETDEVEEGDTYVYDGSVWLLQSNHGKTVTFANIAGDPYDNTDLAQDLNAKQDTLVSGTSIKTVNNTSLLGSGNLSVGDMKYSDFNFDTLTGATITLDLSSDITPASNFTVNAPNAIKDGQIYVLRVDNGVTVYTMTLGTNITNPLNVNTTLTANAVDMFVFLGVGGKLELQPEVPVYIAGTGISLSSNTISNTGVTSFNGSTGAVTYTAPVTSVNSQTGAVSLSIPSNTSDLNNDSGYITGITSGDVTTALGYTPSDYADFEIETATAGATLTISDFTTQMTPNTDFTLVAGTVKEGMQYVVRINSGVTAYNMSLGTGVTNPFGEGLTLTASKITTIVLFATSSSALEIFSVRTAS